MSSDDLDLHLMGVDAETYQQLLSIARITGKSVAEVAADALSKHIKSQNSISESNQRKLLCEG